MVRDCKEVTVTEDRQKHQSPQSHMKIFIAYPMRDGPWGGANQFLKALSIEFRARGLLASSFADADVVILNSHHWKGHMLAFMKSRFGRKKIIHRIDGPLSTVRGSIRARLLDHRIFFINRLVADATVFQSKWSLKETLSIGLRPSGKIRIFPNAPDPNIFFPNHQKKLGSKTRVIISSWSSNPRKGFTAYEYLDQNADFSRFSVDFIGNSPVSFRNIRNLGPLNSWELAERYRKGDIFLTASSGDPASNALTEAIHCGLVPLALDDGGNAEIVGGHGFLFSNFDEMMTQLDRAAGALSSAFPVRELPTIGDIAQLYTELAVNLRPDCHSGDPHV